MIALSIEENTGKYTLYIQRSQDKEVSLPKMTEMGF